MTDDSERVRQPEDEDADLMNLENVLRDLVARADPVPRGVVEYAIEALLPGGLDRELMDLVYDSWVDATALSRGPGGTRMLRFEAGGHGEVRIEVGVTPTGPGFELTGQIAPPAAGELRVIYRGGTTTEPVDEYGRFAAAIPRVASIRLWFRPGSATAERPITTHWVPIG
jgi:hypothetical protein